MKKIVALTLLLALINPSLAVEETGTGVESNEPILYCLPSSDEAGTGINSADEAGSGISSAEEEGSGILSSDESENPLICVIRN